MLEPSWNGTKSPLTAGVHSKPRSGRVNSETTKGCSSPAKYAQGDMRTPGKGSSMVQAPPTRVRLSSTSTRLLARARYAAQARPLWPAPTTTTSQRREANSRTGAGNPISPKTAAVGEITANSPTGTNFGCGCATPDTAASNPVLGSGGSRVMQLGLKLIF